MSCRYGCCGKPCADCGQVTSWDILDGMYYHEDPALDLDHQAWVDD